MPTTFTPLRYPGGKSKCFPLFARIIEDNNLRGVTFIEAYAGGAGAAISLLLRGYVSELILNDLDPAIYAFWRSVVESPADLCRLIKSKRISMAEWKRQKAIYDSPPPGDYLTLGFAAFYLNRSNHSGILGARPVGGMRQAGAYTIKSRFNKTTSIGKIERIAEHAAHIRVFNLDAISLLQRLDGLVDPNRALAYLDPPYVQKGPALYLNHYRSGDHAKLRDAVFACDIPWVLSYDYDPSIMELYSDHGCLLYRSDLRHTITGNTAARELIISELSMPQELLAVIEKEEQGGRRCA